jgi:peptidoglycan hydrolase FlgJ
MALQINPNQLTTPQPSGLAALNAPASKKTGKNEELRESFDSFVGETFYGQMIKSMHKMHDKPAFLYGGRAEEAFQSQLDQTWAEQMSKANAHSFTDSMFNLFTMNRTA